MFFSDLEIRYFFEKKFVELMLVWLYYRNERFSGSGLLVNGFNYNLFYSKIKDGFLEWCLISY